MQSLIYLPFYGVYPAEWINLASVQRITDMGEDGLKIEFINGKPAVYRRNQAEQLRKCLNEYMVNQEK